MKTDMETGSGLTKKTWDAELQKDPYEESTANSLLTCDLPALESRTRQGKYLLELVSSFFLLLLLFIFKGQSILKDSKGLAGEYLSYANQPMQSPDSTRPLSGLFLCPDHRQGLVPESGRESPTPQTSPS